MVVALSFSVLQIVRLADSKAVVSWQCDCGMRVKAMYETDGVTTVRCPNSFCKIPHIVDGKSGSPDIGCLMATQMSGSSTLREVCPRGSPSMPPPITIPSGRPMGAASSSPPIETASVTYIGNYPAALEPMSCCWNRIRTNRQPIGPPMDAFCCSAASIRKRERTCGLCRCPAIKSPSLS